MNPEEPLITTVIPTYKRPRLLKRAILSVLRQDGIPKKICVYDNASSDGTKELVESLAATHPEIEYHCHPENIGGFANFQFGLHQVDTHFFNFLSDDDLLLPDFYKNAIASLSIHTNAMMWAGTTVRMDDSGRIYDARLESWPREGVYSGLEGLACMTKGRAPIWTGVVARSDILKTVGFLDEEVGSASDLDWILRIAARHAFIVSKTPSAILTIHDQSFSETSPLSAFWPGWIKMIHNVLDAPNLSGDDRKIIEELLYADAKRMLFRKAVRALTKENFDYSKSATAVQKEFFNDNLTFRVLKVMHTLCMKSPTFQRAFATLYRAAETAALHSRQDLQDRHGHLARYLKDYEHSTQLFPQPSSSDTQPTPVPIRSVLNTRPGRQ